MLLFFAIEMLGYLFCYLLHCTKHGLYTPVSDVSESKAATTLSYHRHQATRDPHTFCFSVNLPLIVIYTFVWLKFINNYG
jgi:hypothetical protein